MGVGEETSLAIKEPLGKKKGGGFGPCLTSRSERKKNTDGASRKRENAIWKTTFPENEK